MLEVYRRQAERDLAEALAGASGGIGLAPSEVRIGDYVRFRGHNIQKHLNLEWWKVTGIEDGRDPLFHLVNKDGETSRMRPRPPIRTVMHPYSYRRIAGS